MSTLLTKLTPIMLLILFGFWLQKRAYFEEVAFNRIQHMTLHISIPCMLFSTFLQIDLQGWMALYALLYFGFMLLLLGSGFFLKRVLHISHSFFPFLLASFGFGTLGLPLFVNLFGAENAWAISVLGVGHEFFVALFFLPLSQWILSGQKPPPGKRLRALCSPMLLMVGLAVLLRLMGLDRLIASFSIGAGVLGAIASVGSLTLPLTLMLVGYRLRFSNSDVFKTSLFYCAIRLGVNLLLGTLFYVFLLGPASDFAPLMQHAFYILLFQHGSISLTVMVGQYGTREEQEISSNFFVLCVLAGLVLFVGYLMIFPV